MQRIKNITRKTTLALRQASSRTLFLGVLAVLVGLLSGGSIWLFKRLIDDLTRWLFGEAPAAGSAWLVLIPALGGLVVGLIVHFWVGEEKLHGTAGILQSVAISGGRLRYSKTPVKTLAAILSIGSGASVGPEDPSVQIGAGIGSMFGQVFRLPEERLTTLVAAGAAAAIAAAFNAPIAGVFFALEIILGEIGGSASGMIVVAAVTSAVLTQAVSGTQPAFQIPAYAFNSAWELPLYLVLGVLAGPVSAAYVRLVYVFQDLFGAWKAPRWIKPAIAGLAVGAVGFFLPQIFGVGYATIGAILNTHSFSIPLLLFLLIAKLILTPVSIGGGFIGGVFAPSLFIGAALGGLVGSLADLLFPALAIHPAAFALVGMAAVLAGAVHAPLTAALLLFEMTGDYRIILPLMLAVAVSLLVSQRIQRDSVYAMGLARRGFRLDRGRDVDVLAALTVGEVMRTRPDTLNETMSVGQAAEWMAKNRRHGLPVVNAAGELTGVLTLGDIDRAVEQGRRDAPVAEWCTHHLVTATPDEPLAFALRRMSQHDFGRLPVVARDNPLKLVGVLRRADVIHAYLPALRQRTLQRHTEQAARLDSFTPARMVVTEVLVERGSPADGKPLKAIAFPHDCLIASVQRGSEVFIPRGDAYLQAGDRVVVVARPAEQAEALRLCAAPDSRLDE